MDDEKFTLPEDGGTSVSEETIAKIKAHIDVDADVTVDLRQTEAAL